MPTPTVGERGEEINNHVHTTYSFSPYTPTTAAKAARAAGLRAVGIMDHDSVSGAREMMAACREIGIASTVGFELRTNFSGTRLAGRKLNNPDSVNIAYIAMHGIPMTRLDDVERFLAPIHTVRNQRNAAMVERLNGVIVGYGLAPIDFQRDVADRSRAAEGGSITERHLLSALASKVEEKTGRGEPLVRFLTGTLGFALPNKIAGFLRDRRNPYYHYDLLGVLKGSFLDQIFIQPNNEECIAVEDAIAFGNGISAIPVYAYLGDVAESPTGDKKAEKFEDDYLDELIVEVKRLGFKGITYMPPRNTREQLLRLQRLCRKQELMEISGVDINSPRQSFNCPLLLEPEFAHLAEATWALIAHEKLAGYADERYALFNRQNPVAARPLTERIRLYAEIGRALDPHHPEVAGEIVCRYPQLALVAQRVSKCIMHRC